ncbi:hypothetical protein BZG01_20880 [Labilibaculum manganireducens]|uniref:Uncharacterized protein n=1 Tax=Labilibaculum manganireducens TaxID=1940525 RepID=A0A2N3HR28_9BACT|nr:hypothetical protein BZG01_20880 [Labilibaculum manganireducens]
MHFRKENIALKIVYYFIWELDFHSTIKLIHYFTDNSEKTKIKNLLNKYITRIKKATHKWVASQYFRNN